MVSGRTARAPPPKLRPGSFGSKGREPVRIMAAMLVAAAFLVIGLLLGWGFGGSLRNIAHVRVALWWLFPVGLVLQILPMPAAETGAARYLPFGVLLLSYFVLIAVAAINWRLRAAPLILAGLVLNLVPIALNEGMPVSGSAVREVGGSLSSVPTETRAEHPPGPREGQLVF